ncbi:MAG: carboxypeptidase M32 [Candidatus Thermoplasmatota archaeon]|nr:carboxypeptidase M32 [Candidatus Thermoplasmatota archaeon]
MTSKETSLDFIYREQQELAVYGGIGALLGWDQMTYMPPAGAKDRANQVALISRLSHEKIISEEFYNRAYDLCNSSTFNTLEDRDQIVVKKLFSDLEKARKIPSWFVEKSAKVTTLAYAAWEEARKKKDFTVFAPNLEEIITLEQQYCDFIHLPGHPYNSLLDDYEEGMTTDILTKEFTVLRKELQNLIHEILGSNTYQPHLPQKQTLSKHQQNTLTHIMLKQLDLPKKQFRVDVSTHPFTTALGDEDVRITTNFDRPNPLFSLFSTIHEAGHALYELGLPKDKFKDTVISDAASFGMHESQSRFWENMIGRNSCFWHYFFPRCATRFPRYFNNVDQHEWYRIINQVQPSLIRVEADELTYCLHVILRYELELGLIENTIQVKELPQLWNEKMQEFLGVTPTNDVEGVLQDMHWSGGSFGYFPTYAIGTIYAAQLYHQLLHDHPETIDQLHTGNLDSIKQWLHTHIHQYGRQYTAEELIHKTCGTGLRSSVFLRYLKDKYYEIYSLK